MYLYPQVEMVYSLLSMLGTHDKDDMSQTLLAMSSSQDSCVAMRQSGIVSSSLYLSCCCPAKLHCVSKKKLCQLIFCSFSVKYEPISIKIGRIVPEETLHKTVPRMPTSPKVCACTTLGNLKCHIELSTQ